MKDTRSALRAHSPDGLTVDDRLLDVVIRAHDSTERGYHDIRHVLEVLERVREVHGSIGWRAPVDVYFAALFHDAVYLVGASDNEDSSAALARSELSGRIGVDTDRIAQLISLTARHGRLRPEDIDAEAALFLDCDMAILGSGAERFAEYERGVRHEYRALSDDAYDAGRQAFLRRLLDEERIFLSAHFHAALDEQARENIRTSLGGTG